MDDELSEIEALWLQQFIGENWQTFIAFMEERQGDSAEDDANALSAKLEAIAQG